MVRLPLWNGAESFDRAWRQALVIGAHRLTTIAFERAIHGTPRSVWHLPCDVPDPAAEARDALPGLIAALTDDRTQPPGDGQESFRLLPELD